MPLSDAGRAALGYWASIQRAVANRETTAQVWDRIKADQAAGVSGGRPVTLQGVNEIRSAAARVRNSSEAFGAARADSEASGLDRVISSDMMSTAPWSREEQALSTLADYTVRFEARMTSPLGKEFTQMLTAVFPAGALPATVGDLIDELGSFAPASGSLADGTFEGVGDVSILAV
jgi:hypothetical protein